MSQKSNFHSLVPLPNSAGNQKAHIPTVGFGVYQSPVGDITVQSVAHALQCGYRHIDTAQLYGNEADVGEAVKESGIPREEIWITSKVWRSNYGYDRTIASVKESHQKLGTYIDLMLMHSPSDPAVRAETWKALEECLEKGLVRQIGVSNFGIGHLEKLQQTANVKPVVNQIELHPWLQRREVAEYCRKNHIVLEAYSPLAKATKMDDPVLQEVAKEAKVSPAQVLIRWSIQHGFVTLPKSNTPARIQSNLDVFTFELTDDQMAKLDSLDNGTITGWDPITNDPV